MNKEGLKTLEAGMTVGKIIKLERKRAGSPEYIGGYTGVWIQEEMNGITLEHYILVSNKMGESLYLNQDINVRLEIYV